MDDLTNKKFWSGLKRKPSKLDKHEFDEIFEEYLKPTKGTALEIGCVPGNILAGICKKFGYFPEGIDYDSKTKKIFLETMSKHKLNCKVHVWDFNKWKTKKKYDLVLDNNNNSTSAS